MEQRDITQQICRNLNISESEFNRQQGGHVALHARGGSLNLRGDVEDLIVDLSRLLRASGPRGIGQDAVRALEEARDRLDEMIERLGGRAGDERNEAGVTLMTAGRRAMVKIPARR